MKKEIFYYLNYKAYLNDFIRNKPGKGHGFRTVMAEALNCKVAFVSQVLNKGAQFSLEQGEAINRLFEHTPGESDYFLLIIQYERAGTHFLKERIKTQIDRFIEKRQVLKERVDIKQSLSVEDQATYYSHWYYAIIHMLLTLENFQTREAMIKYTNLPAEKVAEVLDFFVRIGIAKYANGKYSPGNSRLFLGNDSPLISKHHTNWRMQAINSLDRNLKTDLHYSSVVSIAAADAVKIKEALIKGMENARGLVRESEKVDQLFCIGIDFFKV